MYIVTEQNLAKLALPTVGAHKLPQRSIMIDDRCHLALHRERRLSCLLSCRSHKGKLKLVRGCETTMGKREETRWHIVSVTTETHTSTYGRLTQTFGLDTVIMMLDSVHKA